MVPNYGVLNNLSYPIHQLHSHNAPINESVCIFHVF
ncbi:hypothetical protein ACP4OV_005322 [Aristida adscensionis]